MLRSTAVVILLMMYSASVGADTNPEVKLTLLANYRYNDVYRYQARCALPCDGNVANGPGKFKVTISLDKICFNFTSFGNFIPTQTSQSSVWYLNNTNWINGNSDNKCVFDLQFAHATQDPVPRGTCKLGWETPHNCLMDDVSGTVFGSLTCFNVASQQLDECYNQTLFSRCCNSCNDHRLELDDCPFGDLRPWRCRPTNLRDNECYESSIEQDCCKSCFDRAENREPKIDGCRYGDKDLNFCPNISEHQCYQYNNTCCDTCYWMSDPDTPDCLYGNKKPELCYNVETYECYNKTVRNDCCRLCNELRSDNDPDCRYGDRQPRCNSIERNDCYDKGILDTCCETCVQSADNNYPDCAYGDRRDCSDISVDDCSSDTDDIQTDCCQTCRFLQENNCVAQSYEDEPDKCYSIEPVECYNANTRNTCCFTCSHYYGDNYHLSDMSCDFGDRRTNCHRTEPWECYRPEVNRNCCETCYYYSFYEEENCKYGDRTPNQCLFINSSDCYRGGTEENCCESCSYYLMSSLPTNCRYGDKEESCYEMPPYDCYDLTERDTCCETCISYDRTDELGSACRYGDRRDNCYEGGTYKCYDSNERRECCRYCQTVENTDNVGCEFGDKEETCTGISANECYTSENTCCATCPNKVSFHNIENCEYGDRSQDCSGVTRSDCYDTNTAFKCCETCWLLSNGNSGDCAFGDQASDCSTLNAWDCYFRETECCETCERFLSPITDLSYCKYGDRFGGCSNISLDQCYNQATQYQCCATCYYKRRTDLPDTCIYGDKTLSCQSSQFHSSECYNGNRRDQCCETCHYLQTTVQNCEYGDKNIQCRDIGQASYFCYNKTVENACCSSCPRLADSSRPGCRYGDSYQYCDASRCGDYPPFRLQECCRTCWDYEEYSTKYTDSTSPSSTSSSPSSTTEEGAPGEKDKHSSNTLPIVGGAIGGVLVVAVIIIVACFIMRRNRNKEKTKDNFSNLTNVNAQPRDRNVPPYSNNGPRNPAIGNPGYKSKVKGNAPQPNRPSPKRQESKQDEEVYDYIDDSDVRSMPSIKRPSVPDRIEGGEGGAAYFEPNPTGNSQYFNPAFQNDPSKDYHTYHVLQKDANTDGEYMKL